MQYLGIEYQMKHPPKLDPQFVPFGVWRAAYLKDAKKPLYIAVSTILLSMAHPRCVMPTTAM